MIRHNISSNRHQVSFSRRQVPFSRRGHAATPPAWPPGLNHTRLRPRAAARGFTLIEMLVATTLTLIMMAALVTIFGMVGDSVSNSRATLEMSERLRAAEATLQRDLSGITVTMHPPRRPEANEGYFEYIEGPIGVVAGADPEPVNSDLAAPNNADTTVGDFDDILMFTTRSRDTPFVGKCGANTVESQVAEIAWFVRGRTLYRRVLLVAPQVLSSLDTNSDGVLDSSNDFGGNGFFYECDISARPETYGGGETGWVPNSLADLTKRENRFAHRVHATLDQFPYDARRWGQLGLPTLRECSSSAWMSWTNVAAAPGVTAETQIDLWNDPHPWTEVEKVTGTLLNYQGTRVAEDVILTNVIGFDVKAWDSDAPMLRGVNDNNTPSNLADDTVFADVVVIPGDPGYELALAHLVEELSKLPASQNQDYLPIGYGAYVDLCYARGNITTSFAGPGEAKSQLDNGLGWTYDTWSFHYEHDGVDTDVDTPALIDEGTDGFDNDGGGIVDDADERETSAPYPVPLRGIQVKIRVFEPDSRQIREVTVRQDFLPK